MIKCITFFVGLVRPLDVLGLVCIVILWFITPYVNESLGLSLTFF